jgi:hypothetical protein
MLCVVAISYTQGREHRLVVNRKEGTDRDRERDRLIVRKGEND